MGCGAASADPVTGVVTDYPLASVDGPLQTAAGDTLVTFQMLQSWVNPFSNPARTAGTIPTDAMDYAAVTFGTAYVEVYVQDLDYLDRLPAFQAWDAALPQ
jgi:hypothetical protein